MPQPLAHESEAKQIFFPDELDDFSKHQKIVETWPFREMGTGSGQFDFNAQIEGCARLIEALRDLAGPQMWKTFASSGRKKAIYDRIIKKTFKDTIRISGESLDFMRTVDYVTKRAMDVILERSQGGKVTADHMKTKKILHHEHMVPGEEICGNLVRDNPDLKEIGIILKAGSCRAIVFRNMDEKHLCEKHCLDKSITSARSVPTELRFPNEKTLRKEHVEPKWHGLFRYHWAGLIDELIPVSERGKELLDGYRIFVRNFLSNS